MYVEPVYARLSTASEANFPILRYVLVSYRGGVGIGTTLTEALDRAKANAGAGDEPTDQPTDEPTDTPSGTPSDQPTDQPGDTISVVKPGLF